MHIYSCISQMNREKQQNWRQTQCQMKIIENEEMKTPIVGGYIYILKNITILLMNRDVCEWIILGQAYRDTLIYFATDNFRQI